MTNLYDEAFQKSINDPNGFWGEAGENVHWYKKWDKVLDDSNKPFYRWFSGGEINTCYNALDFHIEQGRGDQKALIYDSPVTDTIKEFTYSQLRDEVAKFAGVLAAQGVSKGDRVLIYMPMIPEAAIAMLATVRIGAVLSVVFGGFAAKELATRQLQLEISAAEARFNDQLNAAVAEFGRNEGFALILDTGTVAWAASAIDVTTAVIDQFDRMFPSSGE